MKKRMHVKVQKQTDYLLFNYKIVSYTNLILYIRFPHEIANYKYLT